MMQAFISLSVVLLVLFRIFCWMISSPADSVTQRKIALEACLLIVVTMNTISYSSYLEATYRHIEDTIVQVEERTFILRREVGNTNMVLLGTPEVRVFLKLSSGEIEMRPPKDVVLSLMKEAQ